MRIIRLKIKPEVCELLFDVSSDLKTGDRGFAEDLYSLFRLKGNGIPSKERTEKMADFLAKKSGANPINARIMLNRRVQFFRQLVKMAYFKALIREPDPINSVRRLLLTFQKLYMKYREAQCLTCQYLKECDFGKQYGQATTNIVKVIDPDFSKKVHPDCPVRPQISTVNQVAASMAQWKQTAQAQQEEARVAGVDLKSANEEEEEVEAAVAELDADDELEEESLDETLDEDFFIFPDPEISGGAGHGSGRYTGSHSGTQYVKQFEKMVSMLDKTHLAIFTIGQKFSLALMREKKGKFKPTETMSKDRDRSRIKSEADVPKLIPSEHALPSALFNERLGKKALKKQQDMKTVPKKRILYLLVDNSGSMRTALSGNKYGMLQRGHLASVFSITLTKQVRDEGGIVFCRFFSGGAGRQLKASGAKDQFDSVMQMMAHASYDGGSTNIPAAVEAAMKDITAAKKSEEISKSEIIVITDCQDSFDASAITRCLAGHELNVLDISATSQAFAYDGSKVLKKIAKAYYRVDPNNIDINKIVGVV